MDPYATTGDARTEGGRAERTHMRSLVVALMLGVQKHMFAWSASALRDAAEPPACAPAPRALCGDDGGIDGDDDAATAFAERAAAEPARLGVAATPDAATCLLAHAVHVFERTADALTRVSRVLSVCALVDEAAA